MGTRNRRIEEREEVSQDTWNHFIKLSRLCPKHIFSAFIENYSYPTQTLRQAAISRGIYDERILKVRTHDMTEVHNTALKIGPAFPSAPFTSSKWGFYVQHVRSNATSFQNFAADYSARKFLEFMIDDEPFRWLSQESIMTDKGIVIRCEQGPKLEDLLEYELSSDEARWEIPEPYLSTWTKIRGGKSKIPAEKKEDETILNDKQRDQVRSIGAKSAKERRTAPKTSGDLVTLAKIAEGLSIDPRDARTILRKSNTPKPGSSWAWPESEVEAIKKILGDES